MELHPTDIHVLPSFHPHISRRFPLPLPVARKSYQPRSECLNTHPRKNGLFSFQGIFILEPSWKVFLVGISTTDSLLTAAICASSAKLPTLLKGIWGNLERSNGGNRTWHSARWGERAWDWLRPPPPRSIKVCVAFSDREWLSRISYIAPLTHSWPRRGLSLSGDAGKWTQNPLHTKQGLFHRATTLEAFGSPVPTSFPGLLSSKFSILFI